MTPTLLGIRIRGNKAQWSLCKRVRNKAEILFLEIPRQSVACRGWVRSQSGYSHRCSTAQARYRARRRQSRKHCPEFPDQASPARGAHNRSGANKVGPSWNPHPDPPLSILHGLSAKFKTRLPSAGQIISRACMGDCVLWKTQELKFIPDSS